MVSVPVPEVSKLPTRIRYDCPWVTLKVITEVKPAQPAPSSLQPTSVAGGHPVPR